MKKHIAKSTLIAASLLSLLSVSVSALEAQVKAPARVAAKPDLVIMYVNSFYPDATKIKVTVRNNGNAKADSSVLTVVMGNMTAETSIPSLDPNMATEREVTFKEVRLVKGNKMRLTVDSKNHVDESNETNNVKSHVY